MSLANTSGSDFSAVGDYLGIPQKEWWDGWRRKDTLCRHCLVQGPNGYVTLDGRGYYRIYSNDEATAPDLVRQLSSRDDVKEVAAATCHEYWGRCPWCPEHTTTPAICDCSEWREGIYRRNPEYYNARFLTLTEAAQALAINSRRLRYLRTCGKLNSGNGLVGRGLIDMEKFKLPCAGGASAATVRLEVVA